MLSSEGLLDILGRVVAVVGAADDAASPPFVVEERAVAAEPESVVVEAGRGSTAPEGRPTVERAETEAERCFPEDDDEAFEDEPAMEIH